MCDVCGNGADTGHHAVVSCTKAATLWSEMRKTWRLPDGMQLQNTGPDWLLLLLSRINREQKAKVLLLMWRVWFMRNDMIFGKGQETVKGSANFLMSYSETLSRLRRQGKTEGNEKGKSPIDDECCVEVRRREQRSKDKCMKVSWEPPQPGWVKLNTDAGFCIDKGLASPGIVV
jgi:hypothetical protein